MEKTSVQYIKEAAKKLMNSKLQRLGAAKTQEIFNGVMRTVGLETVEEVYLFVAHFDLTCRENASNMDDLSRYFECSTLDMLDFIPALKSLERKGFIVRRRRRCENILKQNFAVSDAVMAAIIENQQVKIGNVTYKVVAIGFKAFANNKKLKTVTIGKNITTIGKSAFAGCKKLKKITIKSTKLKSGAISKNAFKGTA